MTICEYQQREGYVQCIRCGKRRKSVAFRNCTGPKNAPSHIKLLVDVTKRCIHCEAFPCLGPTECKHERAIREWNECPVDLWFYV